MTKRIQFSTIKKAKISSDKSSLLLLTSPSNFDTTGTFAEGRRENNSVQWELKRILIEDPSRSYSSQLQHLAANVGQKLELILEEEEIQLELFPKGSPIMGTVKDSKRNNAWLFENSNRGLEIELNEKASPFAFSWNLGENPPPLDTTAARQQSIQRLKQLWKDNSDNGSETGAINGKNIAAVLGTNWESDFANYDTREDIGQYENQLRSKIVNVIEDKEIKIKFTVKEARETRAESEYSSNIISLKIQTDFLMSTLVPHLDTIAHSPQDAPFLDIAFIFNNEQANSEVYEVLAESEGEEFELSFNLSKIYFEVYGMVNFYRDKPKIAMAAGRKALEVFFRHSDAPNVITIQKTGENPENDDTPKLDILTRLLDAALSSTASDKDKAAALKMSGDFLGFISPENQAKITQINQQLTNKPTQLRQALSEKIENQLTANNLTINELSTKDKKLYNNLKSASSIQTTEIQNAETELTQAIGAAGAKKLLDNLETQIRKILSSSEQDEKLKLQKLLRKFIKSNNSFHQAEKSRARQLNRELKESIQKNDFNQNSETPWDKIILFSCIGIGLTLIILLVYNLSRSSRRRKYTY